MKRKIFSVITVAVMLLALTLAGCGGSSSSTTPSSGSSDSGGSGGSGGRRRRWQHHLRECKWKRRVKSKSNNFYEGGGFKNEKVFDVSFNWVYPFVYGRKPCLCCPPYSRGHLHHNHPEDE